MIQAIVKININNPESSFANPLKIFRCKLLQCTDLRLPALVALVTVGVERIS